MTHSDRESRYYRQLRAEAEAKVAEASSTELPERSGAQILHELQVHQIELEMQNEALREAQIALEKSRDRFVDFYEFAPVGYATVTDTGRIADINLTGEMLLGIDRANLLQRDFSSIVRPDHLDLWRSHLDTALKQENKVKCELVLRRGSGADVHVRLDSLRFLKSGQPPTVRMVLTDITERKEQEGKLKHIQRLLLETGHIGKVGAWEFYTDTGKLTWTDEVYRIHEVDHAYQPTLESAIGFYTPASRPIIESAMRRAAEHGEPYDLELEIMTAKGNARVVHTIGQPDAERGRVYGFLQDITDRKRIETELIKHQQHLEELVQERTAELKFAKEEAEAYNRAKSRFLSNMSHELRTPMSGVMGMIDLALHRATDAKQMNWLNKAKASAQHLISIIGDILDFSSIEADRLHLAEEPFSVAQVIEQAIEMQAAAAQLKGLSFSREISPALPDLLCGDAYRLRQVLVNFVGNAVKFSEQGRITVLAGVIEEGSDSVLLRIEVSDQGIGIAPEQLARLFIAFNQADDSMTRTHSGTGLGLIISRRLAQLMGGDVGVISEEGTGSTFWATVRLKRVAPG